MLKKMTYRNAMNLLLGIQGSLMTVKGTKPSYAILKTEKNLEKVAETINTWQKPSEAFDQFQEKRTELCKTFADKDANLNPIIKDRKFVISDEKRGAFDAELEKLKFGYSSAIEAYETQIKKANERVDEEIDVEIHTFSRELLPDDLTAQQLELIEIFLED